MKSMHDVTRSISVKTNLELWVRAGGRCQFRGHNLLLTRSPTTQRRLTIAEKAHIYAFSVDGPRGHGPFADNPSALNGADNLLLVCPTCHLEIDHDGGKSFSAEQLRQWKTEHERRIELVTGIEPLNRTSLVVYAETIGEEKTALLSQEAAQAVFPERYPADARPTVLSMAWEGRDTDPSYWATASANLRKSFERYVAPLVAEGHHLSVFALAPMPLLIQLGALLTDKPAAQIHQRRRVPQTWRWHDDGPDDLGFTLTAPGQPGEVPALVIALSDHVSDDRIQAVLGERAAVWRLTVPTPDNDLITARHHLHAFQRICRQAMVAIGHRHGHATPLHVFPAMPVSTAVEFGRIRMPKAQMPWVLYDQNRAAGRFVHALTLE